MMSLMCHAHYNFSTIFKSFAKHLRQKMHNYVPLRNTLITSLLVFRSSTKFQKLCANKKTQFRVTQPQKVQLFRRKLKKNWEGAYLPSPPMQNKVKVQESYFFPLKLNSIKQTSSKSREQHLNNYQIIRASDS